MRVVLLSALAAICCVFAACGVGAGESKEGDGAQISVTRDFGHEQLGSASEDSVADGQTVMRFLTGDFDVDTKFGGKFVQGIDGVQGAGEDGQRDWFFWVNGVESDRGAADYEVSPGDRVQWDYRDWRATMRVPAIVGGYPQPLADGWEGKRRPVRLECEDAEQDACNEVESRLSDVGVPASKSSIGAPYTESITRVLVGRWPALRQSVSALEKGPQESGVFVRFAKDGGSLDLLDGAGEPAREIGPGQGVGIVAALFPREEQLAWVITGLDHRGVAAAAAALDERTLRNAFAVAVTGDKAEKLPLGSP